MDCVAGLLLLVPNVTGGLDGVEGELKVNYFSSLCSFCLFLRRRNQVHLV